MSTPTTPAAGDLAAAEAVTADAVRAALTRCPAVAAVRSGGPASRTATYLPGRRVDGVHVDPDRIAVSVVGVQGIPVGVLADQVRTAVAPFAAGRPVDVHVADLEPFESQPPALPPGPSASGA